MRQRIKASSIFIACILSIFVMAFPAYAGWEFEDSVRVEVNPGSSILRINNDEISVEEPFYLDDILFVPLRAILESFGAEVDWLQDGSINIVYKDISAFLKTNESRFVINQVDEELPAALEKVNNVVMIPVEFIEKYIDGVKVDFDSSSNTTTILLEDDGALSDLSFLIGAISKNRIGNSYFGWSMNVPKGSKISSTSFNSKYILVENEHREISLEVLLEIDENRNLSDYLEQIKENPSKYINGSIIDIRPSEGTSPKYIQVLYTNNYEEAVLHRIYMGGQYIYNVILTSYKESNPYKLENDLYYKDIVDSFNLAFSSGLNSIQDISKVKYGLALYENYIEPQNDYKYFAWEICVLPEWDRLYSVDGNPFITELGLDRKEYMSIEIRNPGTGKDTGAIVDEFLNEYKENFNPEYYKFINKQACEIAGLEMYRIVFSVQQGGREYLYNEYVAIDKGLLYDITFKIPEEEYENNNDNSHKMLETFKISGNDNSKTFKHLEEYIFTKEKSRVGKDDSIAVYENKTYGWSVKMPGHWLKGNLFDGYYQSFLSEKSGAVIAVEALDNTSFNKGIPGDEKFSLMSSMVKSENTVFIGSENLKENGMPVTLYKYRLENKDEDVFADMNFRVVEDKEYSYCIMSAIPDLSTSSKNMDEVCAILKSFSILDKE